TCDPGHARDLRMTMSLRVEAPDEKFLLLVTGNSQQFTVALPAGGKPTGHARITSDGFLDRLEQRAPHRFAVYNASAPNLHWVEALWQGLYWFGCARHHPAALIIASSFDTYRQTWIRHGM